MKKRHANAVMIGILALVVLLWSFDASARGRRGHGRGMGMRGMGAQQGFMQQGMGPNAGMKRPVRAGARMLGIDLRLFGPDTKLRTELDDALALMLYKSLNLDEVQKQKLKDLAAQAKALENQANRIKKRYEQKLIPLVRKAKREIRNTGTVSKDTADAIARLRRQYGNETKPIREQAIEIATSARAVLRPEQIQAARTSLRLRFWGPVLESEVQDSGVSPWALAFIDRLRMMPQQRLDRMKQRVYRRAQNGTMPISIDKLDDFFSFVDQIRALSEDDYEAKRLELASDIDPVILDMIQNRHAQMGRGKMGMRRMGRMRMTNKNKMMWRLLFSDSFQKLIK